VLFAASPAPALAQETEDAGLAQRHFERGVELYDREDFEGALASFRSSAELVPSPNSSLYIARCHRGLQQLAAAVEVYEETLREIRVSGDTTGRYAQTAEAAQAEMETLERRVGRLVLTGELPGSASIEIRGRDIPVRWLGLPLPVEPGTILVRVTSPGANWEQSVRVRARQEVELRLEEPSEEMVEPDTGIVTPDEPVDDASGGTPAWAIGGAIGSAAVGAIGWGLAIGFGLAADQRFADLDSQCMGGPCPPELSDTVDEGRTYQTMANVGIVIGSIGTAAAIAFLVAALVGGDDDDEAPIAIDATGGIRFRGL